MDYQIFVYLIFILVSIDHAKQTIEMENVHAITLSIY